MGRACRALGDRDGARMEFESACRTFKTLGAATDLAATERLGRELVNEPAGGAPDAAGNRGASPRCLRQDEQGHRRCARHQREDRRPPSQQHLRQARLAEPGGRDRVRLPASSSCNTQKYPYGRAARVHASADARYRQTLYASWCRRFPASREVVMSTQQKPERIHTVVIGAGQAGLSVGHSLKARGVDFVILDANAAHRRRLAAALGLAAPLHPGHVRRPRRAAVSRAAELVPDQGRDGGLPRGVRAALRAAGPHRRRASTRLTTIRRALLVETPAAPVRGRQGRRRDGDLSGAARAGVRARARSAASSSSTRATTGTRRSCATGDVLIVGAGNSGAEIALELAGGHRVWLSGTGHRPRAVPHRRPGRAAAARAVRCSASSSTTC